MARHNWFARTARKILGLASGERTGLIQVGRQSNALMSEAEAIKQFRNYVYTCALRNGSTVASVPLRLYARGQVSERTKGWYKARSVPRKQFKHIVGKQLAGPGEDVIELTDHPVLNVLRLANPREVGFTLQELTTIFQELVGNAYWYLELSGDPIRGAQPKAIWNLFPQFMKPVPTKDGKDVAGYLYGSNPANTVAFKPDEIIHFRYPNPASTQKGMGPAQAATSAIHRKRAMDEYKQAMYDNDCKPAFVVRVPEDTPADEIRNVEAQFKDKFKSRRGGGVNIKGDPWVVTSDKGIEMLSFPPSTMQDIPQAKLDRDEVYEIFGNPPQMAEVGKSRAELDAAMTGYMWFTILPRLRRAEQTLTERLASLYDPRLFFAFDDPVPENRELMLKEVDALAKGKIITRNEARAAAGYPDIEEGGDEFIAGAAPSAGPGGMALSARPFRSTEQSPFADDHT